MMRGGAHGFPALVARLLLGTLLFAQTVLAAQPCLSPAGSMTAAFSAAMPEGCASQQGKNACLASCLQASQASDTKWLSAPTPVAFGPTVMVVAALASPLSEAARLALPRPDIPLCIRNCRFLN